jgi:pSer/pThr/pTyr-binding forkhead associated (FHA) protein
MTHDRKSQLPDALLSALDKEEEFHSRARGDDGSRHNYYLHELPVPDVSASRQLADSFQQAARNQRSAAVAAPEPETSAPHEESGGLQTITCPGCAHQNEAGSRFCHACGTPLTTPAATPRNIESSTNLLSTASRAPASMRVTLVSINEDGTDGPLIDLRYNDSVLGRAGDIRYPTDAFLSPKHARLVIDASRLFIEDLYSLNGTYVKLREEKRLTPGDTFLMGRQVLRFEKFESQIVPKARANDGTRYMGSPPPSGHFKLVQIGIGGITQNIYCLHESGALIGREKGDIIFPRDKFMSGRHAQIYLREDGHYYIADMGSSNGTWVKIWERRELRSGDFVFLGQQLFRLELG